MRHDLGPTPEPRRGEPDRPESEGRDPLRNNAGRPAIAPSQLLALQRTAGNHAVGRYLATSSRKLTADRHARVSRQDPDDARDRRPDVEDRLATVEGQVRDLQGQVGGLASRTTAIAIAEEYEQLVLGRFEQLEDGVRNAIFGTERANENYCNALASAAAAEATRNAIVGGLLNVAFAGTASWILTGIATHARIATGSAWSVTDIVDGLVDPANAAFGTVTATWATAAGHSANGDAVSQNLPRAPTSGGDTVTEAFSQSGDPLVRLNDTLDAVARERSRARLFFATKVRQAADSADPAWAAFNPEAYRRLYNDWLERTDRLAQGAAAVTAEAVQLRIEKGLWASWLRHHIPRLEVTNWHVGPIEHLEDVPNQVWARLGAIGVTTEAGAERGIFWDSSEDLSKLLSWAERYQPTRITE